MNLLFDPWIPVRWHNGVQHTICFNQLTDPNIADFAFPRADFQGAAYQFVIGVLQTLFAPQNEEQWLLYYRKTPDLQLLTSALEKGRHAFELTSDDAKASRFMQDYDPLEQADAGPIAGLLIEAPGGNTVKQNTDHFIKRGLCNHVSLPMAAIALFTLQINAPAGGQGHRTGLRGGGPLTTLVLPHDAGAPLWKKLWLNVLSREKFPYDEPDLHSATVFPWLGPTKESKQKGSEVFAKDVHPLHMYWAMPRRIRLEVQQGDAVCDLDGTECQQFISGYRTQNYGCNYSGSWWHPLTHYRTNPKKPDEDNLSTKGQPGGVSYKYWQALTLLDDEEGSIPAKVVTAYSTGRDTLLGGRSGEYQRLWAFGYDMDNMKARGWYSTELPLFNMTTRQREKLLKHVKSVQLLASEALWQCRTQIKSAWFSHPGDVKGDTSFIDLQFWQRTEQAFYHTVAAMLADDNSSEPLTPEAALLWLLALKHTATDLFDELVLSASDSHKHMARFIQSRRAMTGWFANGKAVKSYKQFYQIPTAVDNKQEASA
ncbi:MAG: type I-E CRISPR-associated protein Cse1/CasA [Gammaproteobacteria bacterium]|nr:type I-E CRISPR-associated protein Cse1/CasA [Gammaproteobacteria bacterium]MBU2057116.1 type I-E CRISPR-associated protein Cse1/CasA [Gammaproteobacteria bacterium]MBU2175175.1 type I-E CRISPR-associated protein Cse1/CasA [Gammaproteobacteria bacterium]MBU2245206.1 type I-E CRISPR-associated protein Cse1/CasA [Gammaproteobacteria bacterium]MBU2343056.1 type I-E CRISPR-associated protein Cse1/CasA [Gammaproteobacteria bacterium]